MTERSDRLPPLGWLVRLRERQAPSAIVGGSVCLAPWGFSDGVWPGELDSVPGVLRFGASVVALGGKVTVLPASHTIEQVFLGRGNGFVLITNYLPLLSAAEPDLLPLRFDWGVRFAELSRGAHAYSRTLYASRRLQLERYACHPIVIGDDLSIHEAREPSAPAPFTTFESYRDWLARIVAETSRNAGDPRRPVGFPPVATCSSGYDSPAVAVLARGIGCTEALGLAEARDGVDDSGSDVAAALGIRLRLVDRRRCLDQFSAALPFLASGMSASDYALQDALLAARGRLLLTGIHGDVVWRLDAEPSRDMPRGDLAGAGIQAVRVHTGFQHLPVPLIGACWHPEILRISRSPEMQGYRVGGSYDRPIPRRIVEEAGVPREAFGRRKAAANLICRSRWDALGDPVLRRAVEDRVERLSLWRRAWFRTSQAVYSRRERVLGHAGGRLWRLGPARVLNRMLRRRRGAEEERTGPLASMEFLTAVEVLARQFRPAVQSLLPG